MKFKLLTFFLFLTCSVFAQQQPQYGQYMFNQFALNPAYAGSRDMLQTSMHRRSQWDGVFPDPPKTFLLSINSPLKSNKMALGLQVIKDQIGPKTSSGALFTYAYRIKFNKSTLAAGMRFGFYQYIFNFREINYQVEEPIWMGVDAQNTRKTLPAADAGIFYNTSDMYIGLSFNQLIGGNAVTYFNAAGNTVTFSKMKPHMYLSCGKAFKLEKKGLVLNPSFVLKKVEGAPLNIDLDFDVLIEEKIWVGVLYRQGYGLGMLAQVMINRHFKVGFSVDKGIKWMGGFGAARSNEFLLQYDFAIKNSRSVSPKYL